MSGMHADEVVVDDETDGLDVQGQFTVTLADMRSAHTRTLPAVFGE